MKRPNVTMREIDLSIYKPGLRSRTDIYSPSLVVIAPSPPKVKKSFLSRKKGPIIRDIGRAYTSFSVAQLPLEDIPASFKFRTRRAAKRFFDKSPMLIGSQKQMRATFGHPA